MTLNFNDRNVFTKLFPDEIGLQIYIIIVTENPFERKKNFNSIDFEVFCVFDYQTDNKLRNIKNNKRVLRSVWM